jgi:hypothetical protein
LIVLATDGLLLGLFTKDCIDTFTTVPLVGWCSIIRFVYQGLHWYFYYGEVIFDVVWSLILF